MKTNISKLISDAFFNISKLNVNGITKSEWLFRAYRIAMKLNSLNPKIPKSDRLYLNMEIDYYVRILRASKNNGFVAAYSLSCPVEILYAMGIVPLQLEATGWFQQNIPPRLAGISCPVILVTRPHHTYFIP